MSGTGVLVTEEGEDHAGSTPPPPLPESQIVSMIDTILSEEDTNGDGYISYVEFIQAQRGEGEDPNAAVPGY